MRSVTSPVTEKLSYLQLLPGGMLQPEVGFIIDSEPTVSPLQSGVRPDPG